MKQPLWYFSIHIILYRTIFVRLRESGKTLRGRVGIRRRFSWRQQISPTFIPATTASMSPSYPLSSSSEKARDGERPPFLHAAGRSLQSLTANIRSFLPFPPINPGRNATAKSPPPPVAAVPPCPPVCTASSPPCSSAVTVPLLLPLSSSSSDYQSQIRSSGRSATASPSSAIRSLSSGVKIEGLSSGSKGGGGPAFVGQVFSMLDPSGNGLMAVTTHFDIPFLSKRSRLFLFYLISGRKISFSLEVPIFSILKTRR